MTKEDDGGELSTIPNDKYKKFFAKFAEIETMDVAQWKVAHLLGYFCKKYKDTLGSDYSWKFNNESPTKCFEVWQLNTLAAKLSANPKILKEYIDWAFETLVKNTKYKPRSISFLTKEEVVVPYKMNVLLATKKNLTVDRSTMLPTPYRHILETVANLKLNTYGDLSFLSQMDEKPLHFSTALDKLVELGFDKEILKRIV